MNGSYARKPVSVLLWVLAALVVAGAGVAAYLTQPVPPTAYRASAVLAPPTIVEDSAASLNQFVTDLTEKMTTDAMMVHVLNQVPELDPEEYLEGIEASRLGATSLLEIAFVHSDETIARETVEAAAGWIVDQSARTEFDESAYLVGRAEERLDSAQKELQAFARAREVFDPESEYAGTLEQIAAIDRQISAATIEGAEAAAIETLVEQRAALEEERDRIGSVLLTYDNLASEVDLARDQLEQARSEFAEAEYEFTVFNTADQLILSRAAEPFVDESPRIQQTVLAAAIALGATLVILIPTGTWLRNRRVRKHRRLADNVPRTRSTDVDLTELAYDRR